MKVHPAIPSDPVINCSPVTAFMVFFSDGQ